MTRSGLLRYRGVTVASPCAGLGELEDGVDEGDDERRWIGGPAEGDLERIDVDAHGLAICSSTIALFVRPGAPCRDPRVLLYLSSVMLDYGDTLVPARRRERIPIAGSGEHCSAVAHAVSL
jgi:hypothetical protein